jgi:hypothetical protein
LTALLAASQETRYVGPSAPSVPVNGATSAMVIDDPPLEAAAPPPPAALDELLFVLLPQPAAASARAATTTVDRSARRDLAGDRLPHMVLSPHATVMG